MSKALESNLTVAKLKALCVLNDVATTGVKADLLQRLLDAGLDKETLGIEVFDEATASFQPATNANEGELDDEASPKEAILVGKSSNESEDVGNGHDELDEDEPVMLSLEDDDTLTPAETKATATVAPKAKQPSSEAKSESDDEVLDGEVLEAVLVDEGDIEEPTPAAATAGEDPGKDTRPEVAPKSASADHATTLKEMLQRPQAVAVMLALLVLGGGGYYYLNNQLEPFTADSLRYGDTMSYMVTEGEFMATEEYVNLITDRVDDAPNYCKVRLMFEGPSEVAISEGTLGDLTTQSSNDRLGAVSVRGGHGMTWLAVESQNTMTLTTFDIFGHYRTGTQCDSFSEGTQGSAELKLTSWSELRERVTLATQLDFSLSNSKGVYEGTAMTYGVGGLIGDLSELSPGLELVIAPVELASFFGNEYITNDATGLSSGWEWRVTGSEKIGSTNMWKVTASHRDVRDFCLGYATMNLWLDPDSPWVARQEVDIAISSSDASQSGCSGWQQRGIEAVLPEGDLELHHTFDRLTVQRGIKAVELGKAYDNRPVPNELNPDEDDLSNWGVDGTHLPDNSTQRQHDLDRAVTCVPSFTNASGAVAALNGDGYIWRALNQPKGASTEWNLSWVDGDATAGWILFSVSGESEEDPSCELLAKGAYDDTVAHNRQGIPASLPLDAIEARLMDKSRFPVLTGEQALFDASGLHEDTRIGYLVVVPGTGFGFDFGQLLDSVGGATTVDMQRTWMEGEEDHSFSALVDATDGRLIGWTHLSVFNRS